MQIDEAKLGSLLEQMVGEMGAAAVAPLVILGDRLGLYKALAGHGPLTTEALADRTGTTERYVREWCAAQAGSGYIEHDAATGRFHMSPEQQAVFADEDSPTCMTGGYYGIASMFIDEPKIAHAFRTGEGVGWGDHSECLFCGTEKFCTPASISQEVGLALGAQAGPKRLEQVARDGGFTRFRQAAATPFNLILEARP